MSVQVKSTKTYRNLPCGHAQWFDKAEDGGQGPCASIHGYDRAVELTFAGEVDEHGWIFPFGKELKPVKAFIEYYFDHVTVLPADDPRLDMVEAAAVPGGPLQELRVLPSGVSMEMSSLFIWEHVNHYIYKVTSGRVYVEKVRVYEHERNSSFMEVDQETAGRNAQQKMVGDAPTLVQKARWVWESPKDLVKRLNL